MKYKASVFLYWNLLTSRLRIFSCASAVPGVHLEQWEGEALQLLKLALDFPFLRPLVFARSKQTVEMLMKENACGFWQEQGNLDLGEL